MLLMLSVGVLLSAMLLKLYLHFTTGWCKSHRCMNGKTVLVTGANTGIGYYTALDLAKRNARVILACRDKDKAQRAYDNIIKETGNSNVVVRIVDLASLQSIRKFADEILASEERLDVLVNNAGIMGIGHALSEDGLELMLQINYFGPFLLTNLLLGLLKKTENSRIINVSSSLANFINSDDVVKEIAECSTKRGMFVDNYLYSLAKLCNILFTIELAKRLKNTSVTIYSLHPGYVATEMPKKGSKTGAFIIYPFQKSSEAGAQTSIYLSVESGIEELSGEHFEDCHYVKRYKSAADPTQPRKLWDKTEELVKLAPNEKHY